MESGGEKGETPDHMTNWEGEERRGTARRNEG